VLLSRLSNYLEERGRATLGDIALGLEAQPGALQAMLGFLERKGCVRRLPAANRCDGCTRCPAAMLEVYEWRQHWEP
jgi:hypothetical protein